MNPTHTHTDRQFRALLDLFMVADPWPLDDDSQDTIRTMLSAEAQDRGYDGWVDAYHEHLSEQPEPETSNVRLKAYDGDKKVVVVEFGQKRYQFLDVPEDVYREWSRSDTEDYYQENIRGEYRYVRVDS